MNHDLQPVKIPSESAISAVGITPEGQYSEPAVPEIALAVSVILLIAPILGMILFKTGKLALGKREPRQQD